LTEACNKEAYEKKRAATTIDFGKMLDKDLLIYFPVKLVPAVTGFASILILTHNMMPAEYGTYSVVMATVLLMNQIFGSWLSNAVLYVYPDYRDKNDRGFQLLTLKLQGITALGAIIIGYMAILLTTHNYSLALIGALITVSQLFQFLMMTFLQSSRRVAGQAVSVIVQSLSQLVVLCALIFFVKGKEAVALSAVLAGFLACLPVLLYQTGILSRKKETGGHLADVEVFRKLLTYGMPMCIWFFTTQFYTVGDRILLKLMGSSNGLGQYASFRDLATGCAGFLTMPLLMASHPIIMAMWKSGTEKSAIERLMTRNLVVLTMLFVPIFVAVDLCGPEVLVKFFGEKYLMDKLIMLLVVGSIYLGCVAMYLQKGLEVTGQTLRMATIAGSVAILSLLGNMLAIPHCGVLGAAAVVVVVQFLYLSFVWYFNMNILSPKIPISLLGRLVLWVISVEVICRMLGKISGQVGLFWVSPLFRLIFISVATCALYMTNNEISAMCNSIFHFFIKSLRIDYRQSWRKL
jgi:O-antigen/teichoic acid export membrane protein